MARILYVTLGLNPCGGTRIINEHLNRLTDRGHTCYLFALNGEMSIGWMPTKFKVIGEDQLKRVAKKADVVVATEANTPLKVSGDEPIKPRGANTKPFYLETKGRKFYFIQMRESLFWAHSNPRWAGKVELDYERMRGVLQPIVISKWLKAFLEDEYGYEDVPIVPNGLNTEMFYPDPTFPKSEKPRVLIEGHGRNEAKDVHNMSYQAVAVYRKNIQPIELWGFSQYPAPGDFDSYWVLPSQKEIRQIYSSCDVLVKASRYEGGSGLPPIESMACGCAVVVAIYMGNDDLLDGHNCLKVDYGDAQGMYDNLKRVLHEEGLRKSLVKNGLEYVKEHLAWDDKIDLLEAIYAA